MSTSEIIDDQKLMVEGAAKHMLRMQNWMRVEIFPSERRSDGWIEWILAYEFWSGGKLTVGMLQRSPGAELEFHS